jgi:hypothetical protein
LAKGSVRHGFGIGDKLRASGSSIFNRSVQASSLTNDRASFRQQAGSCGGSAAAREMSVESHPFP